MRSPPPTIAQHLKQTERDYAASANRARFQLSWKSMGLIDLSVEYFYFL